jgi:hypothetical protein
MSLLYFVVHLTADPVISILEAEIDHHVSGDHPIAEVPRYFAYLIVSALVTVLHDESIEYEVHWQSV